MGCDGGTIPTRDELVRTKKKPEQKDKVSELSFRWQHCNVSQQPLRQPVVACGLGRLYNKDVVIEKLIDKSPMPSTANHIKSLKDIKNLNLTPNPAFKDGTKKGDSYVDHQRSAYICPMSGLEMNGKFKFCFSWVCGCVFSERALKQIRNKECITCQKPFLDTDIVILNAVDDDDLNLMEKRLVERVAKLKAAKKQASKEKNTDVGKSVLNATTSVESQEVPTYSKDTSQPSQSDTIIANGSVVTDQIRKEDKASLGTKRSAVEIEDPAYKKTKSCYSINKDPKHSGVYKSLFTTHRDAKSSSKAHWVTYNPFYN